MIIKIESTSISDTFCDDLFMYVQRTLAKSFFFRLATLELKNFGTSNCTCSSFHLSLNFRVMYCVTAWHQQYPRFSAVFTIFQYGTLFYSFLGNTLSCSVEKLLHSVFVGKYRCFIDKIRVVHHGRWQLITILFERWVKSRYILNHFIIIQNKSLRHKLVKGH